jgi:hypothetical protein
MAVAAEGIPIRCWSFPGTTSDQAIMKKVKDDLSSWMLNRVVWDADSGFNSAANRAYLQRGGSHYIVAERVREGSNEAKAALARAGRYHQVAGNLEVEEVRLGVGARSQRFCVCHNPELAARDRCVRENLVAYLEHKIEGTDAWAKQRRDELVGEPRATRALFRFVRRSADGLLRIDKGAVTNEARFDGKFLLRTSDDTLSPTDLALAYKQLYELEGMARPEGHAQAEAGLPLPRGPHPGARSALLARAVAHPHRRARDRRHLAQRAQRARPYAPCHPRNRGGPRRRAEILRKLDIAEPARLYDFELSSPVA